MKVARKEKKIHGITKRAKAKTKLNKATMKKEKRPWITNEDTTPRRNIGGQPNAIIAVSPDTVQGIVRTTLIGTSDATPVTTLVTSKTTAGQASKRLLEECSKRPNGKPKEEAKTMAKERKEKGERKEKATVVTKENQTGAQLAWTLQEEEQQQYPTREKPKEKTKSKTYR